MTVRYNTLLLLFCALAITACNDSSKMENLSSNQEPGILEISNSKVKAVFTKNDSSIDQVFYAKEGGDWKEVAASFRPPTEFPEEAVQLFNTSLNPQHRFLANSHVSDFEIKKEEDRIIVILKGMSGKVPIEQRITLKEGADYFHFDVSLTLEESAPELDYSLSTFTFNLGRAPKFVHTPGLKFDNEDSKQNKFKLLPGKDQVIGDRSYHAPAIILQEENLFAALVPDLNAINKHKMTSPDARKAIKIGRNRFSVPFEDDKYTMPTGLDLNVMTGLTNKPVLTFGYMDNIIAHHIRYQRVNDSSMIRTLDSNKVRYEFDLFVGADITESKGFQKIVKHQWQKYGKPVFDNKTHLAMPFDEYFRIIDSITFNPISYEKTSIDRPLKGYKNTGSWLEWEENGQKMGGYRSAIEWWNDAMHNSVFWNNAREAQGFWYWGEKLNRPDLKEKAERIINWCLSAPRNEAGLFATLYYANDKKWVTAFTDPVNKKNQFFLRESNTYDVSTMSKTAAHLLDYYQRCNKDQRIVDYFKPYGDWLLGQIDKRGAVPSYIDERNMVAIPALTYSAQPAASMWFLAELYNTTQEEKYLIGSEKIAIYMEKEILPEQKWLDMEQYFSCGQQRLDFQKDRWQNQIARGTLSTFWGIEGFAALYRATEKDTYLKMGESCIDYVSFYQCTWDPHYIYTAFAFGGFSVDNADNGTYLDARQAEMVRPYIWYGKELGRQDLIERGVAAARSSVVLMNHPRHKANNIYRHTNVYPFGLGPENIDHEAHPQSAMRTHPSWGEGSGVFTGLAEAGRALGGAYVDFEKNLFVGVDGLKVDEATLKDNQIKLTITNKLSGIPQPWEATYTVYLKIAGLKESKYNLIINGNSLQELSKESLSNLTVEIKKDKVVLASATLK